MSLPHAPRIQALAADGGESLAADERQWELYFAAQAAIRQVRACRPGVAAGPDVGMALDCSAAAGVCSMRVS